MTSEIDPKYSEAYVWIWLPGATQPVVAGLLSRQGQQLVFNYGRSYLARQDAIALYEPELPLRAGAIPLIPGLSMPSCIRDASPDAWGRRVLINRTLGVKGIAAAEVELDELTYLLESGSDRIGALDFQRSPTHYEPRHTQQPTLDELLTAAEKVERGVPLSLELDQALLHGSSLGGARPKVLLEDGERKFIAKFSASNDLYSLVKAEFIAMRLAYKVGLHVAPVQLRLALGKEVLLIERFDRIRHDSRWRRRAMVSALTLFELDEMMAAYASYEKLAEIIRHRFKNAKATLQELFARIVFNILCGNTDDHARNHAAFWDGQQLELTPAYDICPQSRSGQQASQAMLIYGAERSSQVATCIAAAASFLLGREEAISTVNHQVSVVENEWQTVCDEANLSEVDRALFWRRQFLNPFAFLNAPEGVRIPLAG
ncbi:MAG: type II toxin-antitoxin system HipA family toxin [Gammaproteobacteria bacterium]|nr:type II toxin-antitoxin system HipA family toxin [Gammaproteobacteria bacterium]MBU1655357.1 type II toxin-antitoxin system HipA family toxin [Gammaproteobacteria bacterium]MBU1960540.1 type II toxin-antitoxin system HipA family toxin [Gammaproteobacteria bacterium]